MEVFISITLIGSALLVGAISPGPSFVLVARTSMALSRSDAIAASIGMGLGGVIFSFVALMGLSALFNNVPTLYVALKILGGLYLVYLGYCLWQMANEPLVISDKEGSRKGSLGKSLLIGLTTQISNPKTAVVYGSIFAALLPTDLPKNTIYFIPPVVFLVEAGWYILVALALSTEKPRAMYLRSKTIFDRVTSCVLSGLGLKLAVSANP